MSLDAGDYAGFDVLVVDATDDRAGCDAHAARGDHVVGLSVAGHPRLALEERDMGEFLCNGAMAVSNDDNEPTCDEDAPADGGAVWLRPIPLAWRGALLRLIAAYRPSLRAPLPTIKTTQAVCVMVARRLVPDQFN